MFPSLWTAEDLVSKISFLQVCPFLCLYLYTTVKSLILKAFSGFCTPSARFTWKDELQWRGTGGMPDWCCHNSINNRLHLSHSSSLLDLKLILGSLVDPLIIGLKVIRQRNRNAFLSPLGRLNLFDGFSQNNHQETATRLSSYIEGRVYHRGRQASCVTCSNTHFYRNCKTH